MMVALTIAEELLLVFQRLIRWFRPQSGSATDVESFVARHRKLLDRLSLASDAHGFSVREIRVHKDRGVDTVLQATAAVAYDLATLASPALRGKNAARQWLTGVRDDLNARYASRRWS